MNCIVNILKEYAMKKNICTFAIENHFRSYFIALVGSFYIKFSLFAQPK